MASASLCVVAIYTWQHAVIVQGVVGLGGIVDKSMSRKGANVINEAHLVVNVVPIVNTS